MKYQLSEGNYSKFGVQAVADGMIFTFAGEKEDDCFLLFYDEKIQLVERI